MWLSVLSLAGISAMSVGAAGCADEDVKFGPTGNIQNVKLFPGQGTAAPPSGPPPANPQEAFKAVFDATKTACGSCHAVAATVKPENVFFLPAAAPTAEATYAEFKAKGFDKAGSTFYTVQTGHPGPALDAAQKAAMDAWIASEAGGGGATDAGGGG